MPYIDIITQITEGDTVSPSVANAPAADLVNNIDYVKGQLETHEADQIAHEGFSSTLPDDLIAKINLGLATINADRTTGLLKIVDHVTDHPGHDELARTTHDHGGLYLTQTEIDFLIKNTEISKTQMTDFNELDYVHISGNEAIYGLKTFAISPKALSQDTADNALATVKYVKDKISGITYLGELPTFADLPSSGNTQGDAYAIVDQDGDLYVWSVEASSGPDSYWELFPTPGIPKATINVYGKVQYAEHDELQVGGYLAVQSDDPRVLRQIEATQLREHYIDDSTNYFVDGDYKHRSGQIRYFYDPTGANTKMSVEDRLNDIDLVLDRSGNLDITTLDVTGQTNFTDVSVTTISGVLSGTVGTVQGTITTVDNSSIITTMNGTVSNINSGATITDVNSGATITNVNAGATITNFSGNVTTSTNAVITTMNTPDITTINTPIIDTMTGGTITNFDATIASGQLNSTDMTVDGDWTTTGSFNINDWTIRQAGTDLVFEYTAPV